MAGVGRLAAGVAHEINNPLAVILGHARMTMATLEDGAPEREALETIADEAGICRDIVNSLLDLSRPVDATAGEMFNPEEVTSEVVHMMEALHLTEGVDVEVSVVDRALNLGISRGRLRQLILNITRNALEVLGELNDGYLHIEGYVRPRERLGEEMLEEAGDAESFMVIVVSDNGPGIPTRNLTRLFEPFYTTKSTGTGLGLAISYGIVRAHGGFIHVETAPAEGTTFTLGVPVLEA
jgi:signal transduction histidine kinase